MMPYAMNASAAFTRAIAEKDLEAAKKAYLATRPIYEQIEVCDDSSVLKELC